MNTNIEGGFAKQGLELLKYAVLLVLYEKYKHGEPLSENFQAEIGKLLGIRRANSNNDELIHSILVRLRDDGYATEEDKWQITPKGIRYIQGEN